jgi:ribose 5-phosphate isomerase A
MGIFDIALAFAGVVDHGLFLDMVDVVIIAAANGVQVKAK